MSTFNGISVFVGGLLPSCAHKLCKKITLDKKRSKISENNGLVNKPGMHNFVIQHK